MNNVAEKYSMMPGAGYFGPARILEIDEENGDVYVMLNPAGEGEKPLKTWAKLAIPYVSELKWGENVLVAGGSRDDVYVIGVLEGKPKNQIVLKNGSKAKISEAHEREKLQVFSKEGGLIFEYDEKTGKSRVDIPSGDLEFITADGNIDFVSAKDIRFSSSRSIDMNGRKVGINADRGDFKIGDTAYTGKKLTGKIESIKLILDRCETVAENIIQKSKNVYKTIENLSQLKTGRMRTLVKDISQFKSRKAFFKAEEDFKINGDKIHLG